jgi:seryl-tRNA synthetase
MADINQIIDPKVIEELKKMNEQLVQAGQNMDKLIPLFDQVNKQTSTAAKNTGDNAGKQKQLTEAEKEAEKVKKSIIQTEAKINALTTEQGKRLAELKLELQKTTAAQKEAIKTQTAAEGSLVRMRQKLKELTTQYDNAGTRTKAAAAEINKLSLEIGKAEAATNRHQRNVGNYGNSIKNVAMKFAGALGLTSAVYMFANALKSTFNKISEFSKENAVLAGVLGKSRKEITQLTEQAVQLGSIYPITATEVNKLQVSYARLGFSQSEIMQLTEATIQASMALNSELDATATLVGAVVKAYDSLGTVDAPEIADKLVIATQKSALSFSSLETALPKVAAAANAMNISLDQTLAYLGVAQDATLDASISGTSLRNIFIELAGRGMTLNEALNQINGSQNKLNASYELFGKRGAIVGLALANNIEKTAELEKEIKNAGGTSERVANEQMATLSGAVSGMASSWEKLMLSFRNSEGVLSTLVGWFTKSFDAISNAISAQNNENISGFNKFFSFIANKQQAVETALKQSLADATRADVEFTIKQNEEKLKNGSKYDKNLLQLMYNRLAEIKIAEEKAAKELVLMAEKEKNEEALRLIEIEKEKQAEITKQQKEQDKNRKKEAENREKQHAKQLYDISAKLESDKEKLFDERLKKEETRKQKELELEQNAKWKLQELSNESFANEEEKAAKENENILSKIEFLKENRDKYDEYVKEKDKEEEEQRKQSNEQIRQATAELGNVLFDLKSSQLQREFQMAEGNAEKQAEISAKMAKLEKRQALFNIAVRTATGIMSALAMLPPNIPLSILVGATGLAQGAAVAAKAIPQFAKGTNYAPGGAAIVGEKGRELIQTPGGKVYLANNPALVNLERGSKVLTNKQTEAYLNDGNIVAELRQTRKAIQQIPQPIFKNGSKIAERRGNYWINYRNLKHRVN